MSGRRVHRAPLAPQPDRTIVPRTRQEQSRCIALVLSTNLSIRRIVGINSPLFVG